MIDFFDLITECRHLLFRHILHDNQRKSALAEILKQLFLSDYRVDIAGQIIEHVVIDAGSDHTEHGRNH